LTPLERNLLVKRLAVGVGFDRAGVARAGPLPRARYLHAWLAGGRAGSMGYLARDPELRTDPRRLLPGARSVICVALNYRRPADEEGPPDAPRAQQASHEPTGRIAQYARGSDYHGVMKEMLGVLLERLRSASDAPFDALALVDTGPLLERELGWLAGLGWIGKNTMLLHHELGSYFFLGELLTTLEVEPDAPVTDHCGSCTRCLEACPTQAFPEPYQMDATRCIAYVTIEHRDEAPAYLQASVGDWLFGCDVCQEVCPFNREAPLGTHPRIMADLLPARLPLTPLTTLTAGQHKRLTRGTAATRATVRMWRRNARIALQNQPPAQVGTMAPGATDRPPERRHEPGFAPDSDAGLRST
jgi:epoxyqueuosine reductase